MAGFRRVPNPHPAEWTQGGVARRRLAKRFAALRAGGISFVELYASVKAWVGHARHADSWGLRRALLSQFRLSRE